MGVLIRNGIRYSGSGSGASELADLNDVDINSLQEGDVLFNNGTEWINKKITIEVTQAEYNAMEIAGTVDPDVRYRIKDGILTCAPVDDNDVSEQKTWSSDKISKSLPQTFEFDVSNISVSNSWGSGYESSSQDYDTGINLTGKKILTSFIPTSSTGAWIINSGIIDNTKIRVGFLRFSAGTTSGKLFVMVTD